MPTRSRNRPELFSSHRTLPTIDMESQVRGFSRGGPNLVILGLEGWIYSVVRQLISRDIFPQPLGLKESYDDLPAQPVVRLRKTSADIACMNDRYGTVLYSWRVDLERALAGYHNVVGVFDLPVERKGEMRLETLAISIKRGGIVRNEFPYAH